MRVYRSGSRFALWRWKIHPQSAHIDRLVLLLTPFFALCVHWLNGADPEPYLHDHPVSFVSFLLRGWYCEQRLEGCYERRWWNFIRATDRHTIYHVPPSGAVTLCVMGPRKQTWGFYTPFGRVLWADYYASPI